MSNENRDFTSQLSHNVKLQCEILNALESLIQLKEQEQRIINEIDKRINKKYVSNHIKYSTYK